MRQRGRKPANLVALNVDGTPPRLQPPPDLADEERVLFNQIIASRDPRHFVESDLPLLVSFVQATLLARRTVRDSDIASWEKAVRVQAMLATKLRLSPQARTDPKDVGRQTPPLAGPPPWER